MSESELRLALRRAPRAGAPARLEYASVVFDVEQGSVSVHLAAGDVLRIDGRSLQRLATAYEERQRRSGAAPMSEDDYIRTVAQQAWPDPDAELFEPHALAESPTEAPWWRADVDQATHMDLRRWLDGCLQRGQVVLELRPLPSHLRDTSDEWLASAAAADDGRSVERVIRPQERTWLLTWWPAALRDEPQLDGGHRGRLR